MDLNGALAEKLGTGLQNLVDGSVTRTRLHVGIHFDSSKILQPSDKIYTEVAVIPPFASQTFASKRIGLRSGLGHN